MGAGRIHGRCGALPPAAGFSLVELLVGVSILAILLALALPSFADWVRNNQVRVAAESMREGLQLARSEAVKRNTRVRFQLVGSLDASCALTTTGPYWVVNVGASVSPAGACGAAVSSTVSPYLVQASPVTAAASKVTITSSVQALAFDAAGRQAAVLNPALSPSLVRIDIKSPQGSCVAGGGNVRCLQVQVTQAGQVRMCDPSVSGTTDPARCY